jgi:hypothetical protein
MDRVGTGGGSVLAEHGPARGDVAAWGRLSRLSLQHQQERLQGALAAWQAHDAPDEAQTAASAAEASSAAAPLRVEMPRTEAVVPAPRSSQATLQPPRLGRRLAEWLLPGLRRAREHRLRRIQRVMA